MAVQVTPVALPRSNLSYRPNLKNTDTFSSPSSAFRVFSCACDLLESINEAKWP